MSEMPQDNGLKDILSIIMASMCIFIITDGTTDGMNGSL